MAATSWQLQLRAATNTRRSRSTSSLYRTGAPKKRKHKAKPPWDNTVSDLSLYKSSPEELQRRHELHLPKPESERISIAERLLAKMEKENRPLRKTVYMEAVEKKKAMIREKFYNQERELQEVLSETDRTMAQVKDLFGDDPMKYKGLPHITAAPRIPSDCDRSMIFIEPQTPSRLTALSESVMITPALNEVSSDREDFNSVEAMFSRLRRPSDKRSTKGDSQEEFSDDDQTRPRVYSDRTEFKSRLDLNYYQNLLQEEQRKTDGSDKDRGQAVDMSNHLNQEMSKVFHVPDHSSLRDPSREPARIASSMQPGKDIHQGGENAQGEAEVLRPITNQTLNVDNYRNGSRIDPEVEEQQPSRQPRRQEGDSNGKDGKRTKHNNSLEKFEDMKTMLDILDNELSEYEKETGRDHFKKFRVSGTFSGYTASLLNAVFRVIHHLKESDIQMRAEMAVREQIMQEFEEQRALVDALTADLLHTQEQNVQLRDEFQKYKLRMDTQYENLKHELYILLKGQQRQNHTNENNTSSVPGTGPMLARGNSSSNGSPSYFQQVKEPQVSIGRGIHLSRPSSHPHIDLLRQSVEDQRPLSVEEFQSQTSAARLQTLHSNEQLTTRSSSSQQQISPSLSPIAYSN